MNLFHWKLDMIVHGFRVDDLLSLQVDGQTGRTFEFLRFRALPVANLVVDFALEERMAVVHELRTHSLPHHIFILFGNLSSNFSGI